MKIVVVTGISTGIGHGIARVLARSGFLVFGSVRKNADAEALKQELGENFQPLVFDVTDEAAIAAAANEVRQGLAGARLDGLVNNAGVAINGPLLFQPPGGFRKPL